MEKRSHRIRKYEGPAYERWAAKRWLGKRMNKRAEMRWNVSPQRIETYSGEKVWKTGDWFVSMTHPGMRCFAVLAHSSTAPERMCLPTLLNSRADACWPTYGKIATVLWDITIPRGSDYNGKRVSGGVIDGTLIRVDKKGDIHYDVKPGHHLLPGTTLIADDYTTFQVFRKGAGTHTFLKRRKKLLGIVTELDSDLVQLAKYKRIESKQQFRDFQMKAEAAGVILTLRRDVPYEGGRSGNILRVYPES
jgi:hypothetical protein